MGMLLNYCRTCVDQQPQQEIIIPQRRGNLEMERPHSFTINAKEPPQQPHHRSQPRQVSSPPNLVFSAKLPPKDHMNIQPKLPKTFNPLNSQPKQNILNLPKWQHGPVNLLNRSPNLQNALNRQKILADELNGQTHSQVNNQFVMSNIVNWHPNELNLRTGVTDDLNFLNILNMPNDPHLHDCPNQLLNLGNEIHLLPIIQNNNLHPIQVQIRRSGFAPKSAFCEELLSYLNPEGHD
jgi:hypothetical protein